VKPASPVLVGCPQIIIAKDQPPYTPISAVVVDQDTIMTRWRLSWWERVVVLFRGNVYLYVMTFGKPLQPLAMQAVKPQIERTP
jgi:hypothetical protein